MSFDAYPLHWPEGRPRTDRWRREAAKFDTSFARARDNIVREVQLLAGGRWAPDPQLVLSTNIALRKDGLPLANQRAPDDPGVAAFFLYKKRQMSIEALRGIARWGTGDMLEAAFTGFQALPAPGAAQEWWQTLGVNQHSTLDEIKAAYRRLASIHHPDRGGSAERMAVINQAYAKATGGAAR
jgi:hypothetical protein